MNEQIDKWINATCEYFNIDRDTLLNPPDRDQDVMDARKVAMYLLYTHVGLRHKPIGKMFHRDRSTIAYHVMDATNHHICRMYVKDVEIIEETKNQVELPI